MSGFMIGTGDGPSHVLETLRSHRWRISELGPIQRSSLLIARDLTLPQMRLERQEVLGGVIYYKYAKSVKWEDAEVTFYDDGEVLYQLDEWKKMVYTEAEGIQNHSNYKKTCVFELLSGDDQSVNRIELRGAWPASIAHSKLTYTSSDIKQIILTLAYDYAILS